MDQPIACPVDQLLARFGIDDRLLIDSLDNAKAFAQTLSDASDALNLLYHRSTSKELYDESQRVHLSPEQEAKRAAALYDVHCLNGHALAWLLSQFFAAHPGIEGFQYGLERDRQRANASGYRADALEMYSHGQWRPLDPAADRDSALAIQFFFDQIPVIGAIQGHDCRLKAPRPRATPEQAVASLMLDMRPQMDPAAFARWEAKTLARQTPPLAFFVSTPRL